MKIKANIQVMNNITFSGIVSLETDTQNGSIELLVLDKVIELKRNDLMEFLWRTDPSMLRTISKLEETK